MKRKIAVKASCLLVVRNIVERIASIHRRVGKYWDFV